MRQKLQIKALKDVYARLSFGSACAAFGIGALAMAGWAFGIDAFKTPEAGDASMKVNTAAGLMLAAGSLAFSSRRNPGLALLAAALASLCAALGALTLAEYAAGLDLRFDNFIFYEAPGTPWTPFPGRMAPHTAVALLLLGVTLALQSRRGPKTFDPRSFWPSIAVLWIAMIVLIGHLIQQPSMTGGALASARMALPTATAFILLSFGTLALGRERGFLGFWTRSSPGSEMVRTLLPGILAAPLVLAWLQFLAERSGWVSPQNAVALSMVGSFTLLCVLLAAAMRRLDAVSDLMNAVFENLPDMLFIKDADRLRFVKVNKTAENLLGLRRSDMIGKTDYDFFPAEQADFFTEKDRQVLESGRSLVIEEERINTFGKGQRWLRTKKAPILGEPGKPAFLLGISEDITDLKRLRDERDRLHEELRQASARIKVLRGLLPICAWCKKIRDDSGYWHKIEEYVAARSEASFSHGLCNACEKKHLPPSKA